MKIGPLQGFPKGAQPPFGGGLGGTPTKTMLNVLLWLITV